MTPPPMLEPPEYNTPCGWCGHPYNVHYFDGCMAGSEDGPAGRTAGPDQCECTGFWEPVR